LALCLRQHPARAAASQPGCWMLQAAWPAGIMMIDSWSDCCAAVRSWSWHHCWGLVRIIQRQNKQFVGWRL